MEELINKLKQIKKEGLTDRQFYAQVIACLDDLKDIDLTFENQRIFRETLLQIGCKPVEEWKKEQIEKGVNGEEIKEYDRAYKGIRSANLLEGVNMVSQFIDVRAGASAAKNVISPGTVYSWPKQWCERNRMLYGPAPSVEEVVANIKALNKDALGERAFYEEIMLNLISTRNMTEMTPEMHREIADALRLVGCQTVEEWKSEKEQAGKTSEMFKDVKKGVEIGDIGTGVAMVEKFFSSYDNAVQMSVQELGGEMPDAMRWVNSSADMREADRAVFWTIMELGKIDKTQMTERAFYESVLRMLSMGLEPRMSREMHEELKDTLVDIGVPTFEEWDKEKESTPERIVDGLYQKRKQNYPGNLATAVGLVNSLMGEYDSARFNFELFRSEPGKMMINDWITNSRDAAAKQSTITRILSKMETRKQKTQELSTLEAKANKRTKKTDEEVK